MRGGNAHQTSSNPQGQEQERQTPLPPDHATHVRAQTAAPRRRRCMPRSWPSGPRSGPRSIPRRDGTPRRTTNLCRPRAWQVSFSAPKRGCSSSPLSFSLRPGRRHRRRCRWRQRPGRHRLEVGSLGFGSSRAALAGATQEVGSGIDSPWGPNLYHTG
jgi:hypothetical protein